MVVPLTGCDSPFLGPSSIHQSSSSPCTSLFSVLCLCLRTSQVQTLSSSCGTLAVQVYERNMRIVCYAVLMGALEETRFIWV